jgi:hypothetical protein
LVATEWFGVWQFDLGGGADSFQLHGGPGAGKCTGCIIQNPAMASHVFLRRAGTSRCILWLHDCFWAAGRWRLDAAHLADAVELSANAPGIAVRCFPPDFARANDSHGFDPARDH